MLTNLTRFTGYSLLHRVVRSFLDAKPDFACTSSIPYTYPLGLDVDVMTFAALERTWHEATEQYQRAHVVEYILEHPEWFKLLFVEHDSDLSGMRWTVDGAQAMLYLRSIYLNGDWQEFDEHRIQAEQNTLYSKAA